MTFSFSIYRNISFVFIFVFGFWFFNFCLGSSPEDDLGVSINLATAHSDPPLDLFFDNDYSKSEEWLASKRMTLEGSLVVGVP